MDTPRESGPAAGTHEPHVPSSRWKLYAFAVVVTFVALVIRVMASDWVGDRPFAIMFVAPIAVSAYAGGLGPGLVATVLATLGTGLLAIQAHGGVHVFARSSDLGLWIILFLTGGVISVLNEALHRARRQSADAARRVERYQSFVRTGERRTQLIVDAALDAVITIDRAGAVTAWNPRAEAIFGWKAEEMIGRPLAEKIIPERFRAAHQRGLERYLAGGQASVLNRRIELFATHRNGSELPVELSITPLGEGESLAFCAFLRDITERRRSEQALVESRQHYQSLAESLPHMVWTCRPDGWCDYLSRQWVDYTGRSVEEQLGAGWADQLHPDDKERVQAAWKDATARGDTYDIEFRIRRYDGRYRWFKTRAIPLRDADGVIVKWFGSNTDFDDFRQSQERLRAQLERLSLLEVVTHAIGEHQDIQHIYEVVVRSIEDKLPVDFCCVCRYDRAANVLRIARVGPKSEPLAQSLGMQEQATVAIGENGLLQCVHGRLVHEPDAAQSRHAFPGRIARAGLRSLVFAPLQVESRVFGVLIACRRPPDAFTSGECEFLKQLSEHVALASHQAELYSALQQAYDDLRHSQHTMIEQERLRALGQMASGIAHDINNAIMPISMGAELLLQTESGLSEGGRRHLENIRHAADDVEQTVARMREFYRKPQRGPATAIDLNRLVHQVVDLSRARWSDMPQQRGVVIGLKCDVHPDLPKVLGDESEIRESLINLVFNAVDAMPQGGELAIRTSVLGAEEPDPARRRVWVEVADTGVGMDPETRRRCLEPFFTTKGDRGTGLGLASVYGMAKRHGADLEIDTAPGRGTTVRLVFAVAPSSGEAAADSASHPPVVALRILAIDDDPVVLGILNDVLQSDGHSVVTANAGPQGIDAFRAAQREGKPFEVVVTDLGMPYMDGRKVALEIKAIAPGTPVILLTGWGRRLLAEEDVPAHVDRVLSKPPKLNDLRRAFVELVPPQPRP